LGGMSDIDILLSQLEDAVATLDLEIRRIAGRREQIKPFELTDSFNDTDKKISELRKQLEFLDLPAEQEAIYQKIKQQYEGITRKIGNPNLSYTR
jgi:phage shock protein A